MEASVQLQTVTNSALGWETWLPL